MRWRDVGLALLLLPLFAGLLWAQAEKSEPVAPVDTRAADLVAELSQTVYTATRSIPASESIFIENGRVLEPLFALARQEHPIVIPAGKTARVSQVVLLDKALHIFFAEDKCALIVVTRRDQLVADMELAQLLALAKEGIAALFKNGTVKRTPT